VHIHSLLSEGVIISELVSQEREAVLQEMVEQIKSAGKVSHHKDLYEKLIQRERLGSTAIGNGIAIPHCKLKEMENPIMALAVSRKGVQFDALDGKPIHLFFLVVSSPNNPGQSLHVLAAVANLVRKSGSLQKKILGAKSPAKILEIIREEEKKIHE
jgi:mannitol/fructose-specific phosphotransferase system IIA component (Ntr-type)